MKIMKKNPRIALFAGVFDPFTLDHAYVINHICGDYDKIVVAICLNPGKRTLLSLEKRIEIINATLDEYRHNHPDSGLSQNTCEICVKEYDGMTVDAAIREKASALIRSCCKTLNDYGQEQNLAEINRHLAEIRGYRLRTRIITAENQWADVVSYRQIQQLCSLGEYIAVRKYVSNAAYQALMAEYMRQYFERSFTFLWTEDKRKAIWQKIYAAYQNRSYHNLAHLAYMLNWMSIYNKENKKISKELIFAIFIHDYIYDVIRTDNEDASFAAMAEYIPQSWDRQLIKACVLATKHQAPAQTPDEQLIADLDLSILGCFEPEVWQQYEQSIRQEYILFNDKEYYQGRKDFLQNMLKKERIFQTSFFYERLEKQARQNILASLQQLQKNGF